MGIRDRIPPRTDILPVFAISVFFVFSWTILWFLQKMPGWLPFLDLWSIFSILAYTLAFALLESILVLFALLVLSFLTPYKLIRSRFISQGGSILFLTSIWIALLQLLRSEMLQWSSGEAVLWIGIMITTIVITSILVHRLPRLQQLLESLFSRLVVFLYIYVPIGILSCMIVVVRNVLAAF